MSSILKALKKLEQDRNSRQHAKQDIPSGILKGPASRPPYRPWVLPSLITAVALVAVLITFTFMGGFSRRQASEHVNNRIVVISEPVVRSESPPVQQVHSVPGSESERQNSTQPHHRPAPAVATPRNILPGSDQQVANSVNISPPTPAQELQTDLPGVDANPLPDLTVNGIAYQKDSSDRVAVVNGSQVSEGALLLGARVVEIFPDRVRFSLGQRSFDVPLGRSSRNR